MLSRIVLALIAGLATPAAAQLSTGASATLADRYVWRGVTRVNGWVLQPAAELELRAGPAALAAGVWGDVELSRAGIGDLGDRGLDRRGLGEVDLDVSLGADAGRVALTAGWVRYTFHGDAAAGGRGSSQNTSEVFAAAAWRGRLLAPEITIFRDVGSTRELYAEAGVTLPVFASPEPRPAAVIWVRPVVGWSAGPGPDRGLTHLDLPLTLDLQPAGGALEPAVAVRLHTQWSRDGATRVTDAVGGTTRLKVWVELTVSAVAFPDRRRRR